MRQINSEDEYEKVIEELVDEHPEWAEGDPFAVANGVVASAEQHNRSEGYQVNFGGAEVATWTLYPIEVIQYSEQHIDRVTRNFDLKEVGLEIDKYAACSLALDIKDHIESSKTQE